MIHSAHPSDAQYYHVTHQQQQQHDEIDTETAFLYRRMKFLKSNPDKHQDTFLTTNNMAVKNFIEDTKIALDEHLKNTPSAVKRKNISENNRKALKSLTSPSITIKPADKNLGIVILNSKDYVTQCLSHLSSNTYVRVTDFPANSIKKNIENVLIKFKDQLSHHRCLYQYLQPTQEHMTPKFYGLPKIHKPPNYNLQSSV